MMNQDECKNYLRDLSFLVIEKALDAKRVAETSRDSDRYDYDLARSMAFYEVVSLMQQQAEAFGIPLDEIGLNNLDPEKHLL